MKQICEKTGKQCYSREVAGMILNCVKRNRKNIPKRCYKCCFCGAWHLTHLPFYGNQRRKKKLKIYR